MTLGRSFRQAKAAVNPQSADKAMDALARLLSLRERSVAEVRQRLIEKGYTQCAVEQALERALACGLLNDERFARGYLSDKLRAGWGERRIAQELRQHGIDLASLEGYPDEFFSEDTQVLAACALLRKHTSRAKDPRQAAFRYLMGKGYSSSVAQAALREVFEK